MYYGIFYALSALALKFHFSTKKHTQLLGWFNKNFVKDGKVEKKFGEIMYLVFDKRSKGDYDDFVQFTKDEAEELFVGTKEFILAIEQLIATEEP